MKQYSEYVFGDMLAAWWLDEQNHMGLTLIPADMRDQVKEHSHALEPLVQIHARGDQRPHGLPHPPVGGGNGRAAGFRPV